MEPIVIYGADWCGDCRRAKAWVVRNELEYVWVDVEANPDEIETVIRYNEGRRNIPVVIFPDGSHLTEPTDADLNEKCRALGLPCS